MFSDKKFAIFQKTIFPSIVTQMYSFYTMELCVYTNNLKQDLVYVENGTKNPNFKLENPHKVRSWEMYQSQGGHGKGNRGNLDVHFSRQGKHREFAKKY